MHGENARSGPRGTNRSICEPQYGSDRGALRPRSLAGSRAANCRWRRGRDPGLYRVDYTIPGMFLKSGIYSIRVGAGTPYKLFQDFESALRFEIEERSINTHMKGYRRGRPGHVISPGVWKTTKLE